MALLLNIFERTNGEEEYFAAEGIPMAIWVLQNGYSVFFEVTLFLHACVNKLVATNKNTK